MADLVLSPYGGLGGGQTAGGISTSNFAMSVANLQVAWVFQAKRADTVSRLMFRYAARTGTPPTYRVSLQGVNTSGNPDGTVLGGGTPASATFTPPATTAWDGTIRTVSLDNDLAVTRGQLLAMVVDYSAGTVDAGNNGSFTQGYTGFGWASRGGLPYSVSYNGSAWTKSTARPIWGLSGSIIQGEIVSGGANTTLATNGHRAALKFTLPAAAGATFKVAGARFSTPGISSSGSWKLGLWDAAGSVIQDVTLDTEVMTGIGERVIEAYFDEASLTALNHGTPYYLGVERVDVQAILSGLGVGSAGNMVTHPGGENFYLATWDGSAWTDVTTTRPVLEILLDDWTEPAGGATSAAHW